MAYICAKKPSMKNFLRLLPLLFLVNTLTAQLSGTLSIPGTYSTIAAAINDLNTQGINGPVTLQISAGYTETTAAGGYSLTATGTAANPIVFQKNGVGANPLVLAYAGGTAMPSSALQDGIWRLIGSDYVTIDGIDLLDQNTANPATMEFGYGLFKASAADGCNNNTIRNCVITLNRNNVGSGTVTAMPGSRGIDMVNATSSAHTTSLTISTLTGASSNNKFYSNTIQNCNIGIALTGFADASPFTFTDQNNDVGGLSALTGNTIINYGGGVGTTTLAAAVKTMAQDNINISFNLVNSNNGSGVEHTNQLCGIYADNLRSGATAIKSNTVTVKGGNGGNTALIGIRSEGISTAVASLDISSNLIQNCVHTATTGNLFMGIYNNAGSATLNISSNTFTNIVSTATTLTYYNIYTTNGRVLSAVNNNAAGNLSLTNGNSGGFTHIFGQGGGAGVLLSINSNSLEGVTLGSNSSMSFQFIDNSHTSSNATNTININNNVLKNTVITTSAAAYFIKDQNNAGYTVISGNIINTFNKTLARNQLYCYYNNSTPQAGTTTISGNNFSNLSVTGATDFYGIFYSRNAAAHNVSVRSNTIANVSGGSNNLHGIYVAGIMNSGIVQDNLLSDFSGSGYVAGVLVGSNNGSDFTIATNTIRSFTSSGISVTGYQQNNGTTVNVFRNRLYDFATASPTTVVYGMNIMKAGSVTTIYNNLIGDFKAPVANSANLLNAIYITGGPTVNLQYNTVRLAAVSTGTLFGSSVLTAASSTPVINARNNIFINLSTPLGAGITAVYKNVNLPTYGASSNNNLMYAGVPSASNVISGTLQTMAAFITAMAPRDAASVTENTSFLSVTGTAANFLHVAPPSLAESNAVNIAGITSDIDTDIRQGNPGYTGNGTAPDIGADEFNTVCSNVTAAVISPASSSICTGETVSFTRSDYPFIPDVQQQWQRSSTAGGPYTSVPASGSTALTTPALATGTYYYVLTSTCTISSQTVASNEATVTVYPYPSISVSPASSVVCANGNPVTLTASGANTYTWSPATGLSVTGGTTVSALPAGTTTYIVTGANPGGCTGTTSAVINIIPTAVNLTLAATPTLICQGSDVTLQAIATSSVYSVTTIPFAPISTPTSGAGVALFCNNGNNNSFASMTGNLNDGSWNGNAFPFFFNLYGTNYAGFSVSTNGFVQLLPSSFPVIQNAGYGVPLPSASAALPAIGAVYADLDFSNSGYITSSYVGTSPNRRQVINWVNGRFYNGAAGSGTVTTQLIIFEASNWIEVHTTVSSGQLPAVEGIQNNSGTEACVVPGHNSQTYTVTNSAHRWYFPVTYLWTPSAYLSSTSTSVTTASNIQANITYTVEAVSANGCGAKAVRSFSVIPSPTLSIAGGTNAICAGSTTVSLSASGANTYTWSNGASTATVSVSPLVTTTYVVSGSGTTNSCISSATQVVTVTPIPAVNISGSSSVCNGQNVLLTAGGADTYVWSNGAVTSSTSPVPAATTVYSVTGTATLGSCTGTAQTTVTVYPNPTVTISGNSLICSGQTTSLTANGAGTYSWSISSNAQTVFPSPAATTVYSVTGTASTGGCTGSATYTVNVNPSPTVAISGNTVLCAGQSVSLSATGGDSYLWNNGAASAGISVTPPVTTLYNVTGTSAANGCTSTAVYGVSVVAIPNVGISGITAICPGQTANLTANGAENYTWSNGSTLPSISVSPAANITYSVTGTSGPGCSGSAAVSLSIHPVPTVTIYAAPSATICQGETAQLSASVTGANTYLWSNNAGSSNISVTPQASTAYSLQVTSNITGCSTQASYNLQVDACTGLSARLGAEQIKIYPNPFSAQFYVETGLAEEIAFEIIDTSGRIIGQGKLGVGTNTIDMSRYARGIYYLKTLSGHASVNKIISR